MRFFFYGTLIAGSGNRVAAAVHGLLRDMGPATVRGLLYAVSEPEGWYPLLLPGAGTAQGRLYAALPAFGAGGLAALDAWEDFDPADPARSLYLRETIVAKGVDGSTREAQAYCFNRPLPPGAEPIPEGDFAAWLVRTGRQAYGATQR